MNRVSFCLSVYLRFSLFCLFCLVGSQSIFCAAVSIANILYGHFVFVNPVAKKELSESGNFLFICVFISLCVCVFFVFSVFLVLNPFSVRLSPLQMFYRITLSLSTLWRRKSLVNQVSFVYLCFCLSVFLSFLSFWFSIHFLCGCVHRKCSVWSFRLC